MAGGALVAATTIGLLSAPAAWAETYAITTVRISGPCEGGSKYTLSVQGDEIVGRSPIGSRFTTTIAADGSFKAVFKSYTANRDVVAEGNARQPPRRLRITIPSQSCVLEGTE
jgi:hypothetical protein